MNDYEKTIEEQARVISDLERTVADLEHTVADLKSTLDVVVRSRTSWIRAALKRERAAK